MTVYEMRTYTLHVGKMGEAVKLYTELGYPALQKGGRRSSPTRISSKALPQNSVR